MEIIAIEERTFELMKKRFEDFVVQVEKLCNQNQKTEWPNNEQVCEMLKISKRTLQSYRDNGTLFFGNIFFFEFYSRKWVFSHPLVSQSKVSYLF